MMTPSLAAVEPKIIDGSTLIKKAQGVIRQLVEDKAALSTENTRLLNENKTLQDQVLQLKSQKQQITVLQNQLTTSKQSMQVMKTDFETKLTQELTREQAIVDKHNALVAEAEKVNEDNQLLVKALQEREQWIGQCSQQNGKLLNVNQQLIASYKEKGFWQQLADLEPLTGIGTVQTENTAEQYRYNLKHLKITPFQDAPVETPAEQAQP